MIGRVLTPVFDPSGIALELFKLTCRSVEYQRFRNFRWVVSLQDGTDAQYREHVHSLDFPHLEVRYSRASSLRDHVQELLSLPHDAFWTHILCQDDAYLTSRATQQIDQAHRKYTSIVLTPEHLGASNPDGLRIMPRELDRWRHWLVQVPVNRIGGLSSLTWRTDLLVNPQCRFSLFADVDLLNQLLSLEPRPLLLPGIVGEHRWEGQAQGKLIESAQTEFETWVTSSKLHGWRAVAAALTADAYGYRKLGNIWASKSRLPLMPARWISRAVGAVRAEAAARNRAKLVK